MESRLASTKTIMHPLVKVIIALLLCFGVGYFGATKGMSVIFLALSLPFVILYFIFFFRNPKLGVYTALVLGFILPILARYTNSPIPFGLGIDILLVLTYVIVFLKHWKYLDFRLAANNVVLLISIWMGYIVLQIANPEARSIAAWFYTMRGMGLYQFLLIPLGFILFNSRKDWYNFFNLWLGFTILAILWALKQSIIGVSAAEQAWLDGGAATTHVLFGKLRVFSYYYDAGTFGASMGQISIMCFILFLGPYSKSRKAFYFLVGLFSFYALMLSGTRGALAVPAIGGILYLIMIRNVRLMIVGAIVLFFGFSFLKFTTIMHSNDQVRRLRTALNPEDASLNVRLKNRERLTTYLQDKPFGGGLGTSGVWGQRFSPNTWLANFPPDGLYTRIRAETGLVGRLLYVGMWLFILGKGVLMMWKLKREENRVIAMAFLAGYAGILMANYGNEVMTQFPISVLTFLGIPIILSMKYWNEEGEVVLPEGPTPVNGALYPESRWLDNKVKVKQETTS
jgi:hypothetical protein